MKQNTVTLKTSSVEEGLTQESCLLSYVPEKGNENKGTGGKYRERKQRGQGTHEVEVFLTSGKQPANTAVCVSCLSTFILNTAKIYIKTG